MQVFQTAGEPPSNGNNILPNIGCITNIKDALMNNVAANKKMCAKFRLDSDGAVADIRLNIFNKFKNVNDKTFRRE